MEVDNRFPKEKLHEMVEKLSDMTPDQRIEFLTEMMSEIEKDVQARRRPPINWNLVLDRFFSLAEKYIDTRST